MHFFKKKALQAAMAAFALSMAFACQPASAASPETAADLVVYGKVYTSNANARYADAFAVKDGKYIYVGNKKGANAYIQEGVTKVVDRTGKGLITAGATEGHGHYVLASELKVSGGAIHAANVDEILATMKEYVKAHPHREVYFVMGWETGGEMREAKFTYNMRKALDAICPDKAIIMVDNVGHNAFLNSKAFEMAGYTKDFTIEGGTFAKDANGDFLGLVSDVAVNYALEKIQENHELVSKNLVREAVRDAADFLHANGYTNYFDAFTNVLGKATYEGVHDEDVENGLTFNMIAAYKIDPYADIDEKVDQVAEYMKKYSTNHFKADNIKLFADGGAVEVKTGWMLEPYADGSHGNQVWQSARMYELVKKANAKGVSVHTHASGDGATAQVVDAYIQAEDTAAKGIYNGLGHSRHITEATKDKMAAHHIYSATNICWRYLFEDEAPNVPLLMDYDLYIQGYPMKSLLDRGIVMTSSTDYPAGDGAPTDICGIIEIGVNGSFDERKPVPMAKDEYLTVEEMLDVMTINGAKQFQLENERGSIEVGKYADFLLLDKDITTCAADQIHEGKVDAVYFEGKKVYKR